MSLLAVAPNHSTTYDRLKRCSRDAGTSGSAASGKEFRMHQHPTLEPPLVTPGGVLFLRGYAASLWVHRGQLVARCGSGPHAPEARFARGARTRIRPVVVL